MTANTSPLVLNPPTLTCPTCGIAFHDQSICRRCGADLSLLMKTAAQAYTLRDRARQSLLQGRFENALRLARKAQTLHKTDCGRILLCLAKAATQCESTA